MAESDVTQFAGEEERLLILSDGKPGHVNQSIAFAKLLNLGHEIRRVRFKNRFCKALSYLFDRVGLFVPWLFTVDGELPHYSAVASAGSDTYYANRVLSHQSDAHSVAIMLPKGYKYTFDLIIAQRHDRPPAHANILPLPVNLSFPVPAGFVSREDNRSCVSLIIGGSSRHFKMEVDLLKKQLNEILELFPDADLLVTTSRRTPGEVEALINGYPFRYKVIASRDNLNPIADFLSISDYVFVTEDSTSMISEAVSFGHANVEVLPVARTGNSKKFGVMLDFLLKSSCLHYFDGTLGKCSKKVDLAEKVNASFSKIL